MPNIAGLHLGFCWVASNAGLNEPDAANTGTNALILNVAFSAFAREGLCPHVLGTLLGRLIERAFSGDRQILG